MSGGTLPNKKGHQREDENLVLCTANPLFFFFFHSVTLASIHSSLNSHVLAHCIVIQISNITWAQQFKEYNCRAAFLGHNMYLTLFEIHDSSNILSRVKE